MGLLGGAIALIVAGQIALPNELPEPRGTQARVDSKQATYDGETGVISARGDAVLRTEQLVLRADELIYDEQAGTATARGNVRLVQDLVTAFGDEATIQLDTLATDFKGGLIQEKRLVSAQQLRATKSADEIKKLGINMLSMTGTHLQRVGPHRYLVDHLSFTPCDCSPERFNWKIKSYRSDIEPGERAILYLPVIYINNVPFLKSVPILPLPILYLPLSDRRTGLLPPDVKSDRLYGDSLDQPLFITLGRSHDLTLTPGYYFGSNPKAPSTDEVPYGIRGPRLRTEYRYVLKNGSSLTPNHVNLGWMYDLKHQRDPANYGLVSPTERRGLRWEASWVHQQDLGKGFRASVNASALSDGNIVRDLTSDVLMRETTYLRSSAALSYRTENQYAAIDTSLRQDLRWGYSLFGPNVVLNPLDRLPIQQDGHPLRVAGPNTIQRFPGITFALPERHLAGPFYGGVAFEYSRLAPLRGSTGDEGRKGLFDPSYYDEDGSQGNGRFESGIPGDPLRPGEREARDRIDVNPRLSAPFSIGQAARITPYVSGRDDIYFGEVTGRAAHRGYLYAGSVVETELARVYSGKSAAFRHSIRPNLDVRYLPYVFGAPLGRSYDEIDRAIPAPSIAPPNRPVPANPAPGTLQSVGYGNSTTFVTGVPERTFLQAVAQVRQTLAIREGTRVREVGRLDLGQGFDLLHSRLGDAFARVQANQGGTLTGSMAARYDVSTRRLAQLYVSAAARDRWGDFIGITFEHLLLGGSDQLRRGIDELVGPRTGYICPAPLPYPFDRPCPGDAQQLSFQGSARRFGFELAYYAIVQPAYFGRSRLDYSRISNPPGLRGVLEGIGRTVTTQTASLSYGPACDCWKIGLAATIQTPIFTPSFHLIFTVSQFGSFHI